MAKTLHIAVNDKVATYCQRDGVIVCGNSDYEIEFAFDSEWSSHAVKTARFIHGKTYEDVVFEGNTVAVPVMRGITSLAVGVFSGNLKTTTPALITCRKSVLCEGGSPSEPTPDVYAQIIELLNKGGGGGGSGNDGDVQTLEEMLQGFEKDPGSVKAYVDSAAGGAGADGGHYTPSVVDNGDGTMTISFTANKEGMAAVSPVTVTLPQGADGAHVIAVDEMGGDDTKTTYKMRFSDGSGYDFDVYHGHDGDDGNGIKSIAKTSTSGVVDTYTITFTDNTTTTFTVTNGRAGTNGKTAYQYAQDGGYTGTEAEFAEKLATEYATSEDVQAAVVAAESARDTASEKAADAETSAQTATNAAQTATNAAQRAEAAAGGTIADGSITPEKTTFVMKVGEGEPYIERTPDFTPVEKSEGFAWESGKTLNGSVGSGVTVGDKTNSVLSPYIPVALGKMIRIKGMSHTTANRGAFKIAMFNGEKVAAGMSPVCPAAPRSAGTGCLEAQDPTEFSSGVARYKVGYTVSTTTAGYESGVVGSSDFIPGTQSAIAYIRICGIPAGAVEDIAISIDEPITYTEQLIVPEGEYILDEDIKVPAAEEALEIAASLQVQAGGESPVEIILNDEDVAVVGQEYNLYHFAVCHGNRPYTDYDIVVTLSYVGTDGKTVYQSANNFSECFRFVPTTARDYTLTYRVRAKKPMSYADAADLASKSMTLHVIPNTAVSGKRILVIGDSFTDAGYWVAELQHNLSHGGIVSVGTVSDTVTIGGQSLTVLHEGRSGWAAWDYAGTAPSMTTNFLSARNVFRNSAGKFDLAHYFNTYHNGATVDAVCIFLGTNGLGADVSTEAGMTELINRVREYDADIPILLHYTIQNAAQDYWSKFAEQHTNTRDYRQYLCRKQYEIYRTKYASMSNVYIVPVYENLDYERDFPKHEVNASARNAEKIYRVTDGHPSKDSGYLKMADTYYAWLLYVLTKA